MDKLEDEQKPILTTHRQVSDQQAEDTKIVGQNIGKIEGQLIDKFELDNIEIMAFQLNLKMPHEIMLRMANKVDKNGEAIEVSNREVLQAAIGLQNSLDKRYVNDLNTDDAIAPPAVNISFKGVDSDSVIIEHDAGDE